MEAIASIPSLEFTMPKIWDQDRLEAWNDGSAICVIAVGAYGDPLDLSEHQVEDFIQKLQRLLEESRGVGGA